MAPPSRRGPPRNSNGQQRRRPPRSRDHSRNMSSSALLAEESPRRNRDRRRVSEAPDDTPPRRSKQSQSFTPSGSASTGNTLSAGSLAKLNALNEKAGWDEYDNIQYAAPAPVKARGGDREKDRRRSGQNRVGKHGHAEQRKRRGDDKDHNHYREKRRVVSGPLLEEGGNYRGGQRPRRRGGDSSEDARLRKKRIKFWTIVVVIVVIIAIIIGVAVGVSKHGGGSSNSVSPPDDAVPSPTNNNLKGIKPDSIPKSARGTYYDPFDWYDTMDFNVTYTAETVGGLPIMGLNSTWDDNVRANPHVPPLTEKWHYGYDKVMGMNLGGWLSIEPFITPSFFDAFQTSDGVIDEYTLTQALGPTTAATTLEQHYSAFVSEQTFADIQAAGFDHVRIPYSYWAVTTYPGDPYVPMISWRYLLRGIEWARKHGLRVNLDLHGAPGSQNGWNHSGRQGPIGWLNGTDGALNAQRTIDIHKQLGRFFAQPRYKNLITMYGLVNEPRMVVLNTAEVTTWSTNAISALRASGLPDSVILIIGDGFLGLNNWQGSPLSGTPNVLLDAHQYVIFNDEQIVLDHERKLRFACRGWAQQSRQSSNPATGFGNFLCGEWSQADTDCVRYLNDVGVGARWDGTMDTGNASTSVLTPTCPTDNHPRCDCDPANADPASYSDAYKLWLKDFAEAQMHSYELGWGWFYWTWKTESAVQWSYELGLAAGILPANVRDRAFNCDSALPDFPSMGLPETY